MIDMNTIHQDLKELSDEDLDVLSDALDREVSERNLTPLERACLDLINLFPGTTCIILQKFAKVGNSYVIDKSVDLLGREIEGEIKHKNESPVNHWVIERQDALALWEKIQGLYAETHLEQDMRNLKDETDKSVLSMWYYDDSIVSFFEFTS